MTLSKNQFKIEKPFKEIKVKEPKRELNLIEEEFDNSLPKVEEDEQDILLRKQEITAVTISEKVLERQFTSVASRLTVYKGSTNLDDDAEIKILAGSIGWGFVMIGDNQEYAHFAWTSAGVVTLINNSANAVNTDTDAKLCIYDVGTGISIKNRLGSTLKIRYELNYK